MEPGPRVKRKQADRVVPIRRQKQYQFEFVTQMELAEERLLTAECAVVTKALEKKRKKILKAIENGAEIEPGVLRASVIPVPPKSYTVERKAYKKLIVR